MCVCVFHHSSFFCISFRIFLNSVLPKCIDRVPYFLYLAKKPFKSHTTNRAAFVNLRYPFTILVTYFTDSNNLSNDSFTQLMIFLLSFLIINNVHLVFLTVECVLNLFIWYLFADILQPHPWFSFLSLTFLFCLLPFFFHFCHFVYLLYLPGLNIVGEAIYQSNQELNNICNCVITFSIVLTSNKTSYPEALY